MEGSEEAWREKYERDVMICLIWGPLTFSPGASKSVRDSVAPTWSWETTVHEHTVHKT